MRGVFIRDRKGHRVVNFAQGVNKESPATWLIFLKLSNIYFLKLPKNAHDREGSNVGKFSEFYLDLLNLWQWK